MEHIDSKNLVPFSKRRDAFRLPGMKKDREEEMLEQVDPGLSAEDQGVIRRYLSYADILLGNPDEGGLSLVEAGEVAKDLAAHATTVSSNREEPEPNQANSKKRVA